MSQHTHTHTHTQTHTRSTHLGIWWKITCSFCRVHFPPPFPLCCRALHDFEAETDSTAPQSCLSFKQGDIIHVLIAGSEEWWQAAIVNARLEDGPPGLIPSRRRWDGFVFCLLVSWRTVLSCVCVVCGWVHVCVYGCVGGCMCVCMCGCG